MVGHTCTPADLVFEVLHHLVARRSPSEFHDYVDQYFRVELVFEVGEVVVPVMRSFNLVNKSYCRCVLYTIKDNGDKYKR